MLEQLIRELVELLLVCNKVLEWEPGTEHAGGDGARASAIGSPLSVSPSLERLVRRQRVLVGKKVRAEGVRGAADRVVLVVGACISCQFCGYSIQPITLTNAGEIRNDCDLSTLQKRGWANTATLEDLRGVEESGSKDDLLARIDRLDSGAIASLDSYASSTLCAVELDLVDAGKKQDIKVRASGSRVKVLVDGILNWKSKRGCWRAWNSNEKRTERVTVTGSRADGYAARPIFFKPCSLATATPASLMPLFRTSIGIVSRWVSVLLTITNSVSGK